jgi:DNA-binding MarR family transcriptional regulator
MTRDAINSSNGNIVGILKTLHIVKRRLLKEFCSGLSQGELHPSSGRTLHIIIACGRLTMSKLHDLTGFERGSLTTIVDGLIELGYVERIRGEKDRRKVFVVPTQKGISMEKEMHKVIDRHVKQILGKLSSEDRARFFNAIKTLDEIAEKL